MVVFSDAVSAQPQWQTVIPNLPTLKDAVFLSEDTGYIAGSNEVGIRKTTNGGASWQAALIPYLFPPKSTVERLHLAPGNEVWAVGRFQGIDDNFYQAVHSTNGENWEVSLIQGVEHASDICFVSAEIGFLAADTAHGSNYGNGFFFRTTDGGEHWTKISELENIHITRVAFKDAATGMAIGWSTTEVSTAYVFRTTDGGETWKLLQVTAFPIYDYRGIDHIEGATWIVAGGGGIYRTTDDGDSWTIQHPLGKLRDIEFYNNRVGYGASEDGTVFYSEDGGVNWVEEVTNVNSAKLALAVPSEKVAYVIGANGAGGTDTYLIKVRTQGVSNVRSYAAIQPLTLFYNGNEIGVSFQASVKDQELTITDVLGRTIYNTTVSVNVKQVLLPTNQLSSGSYLVRLGSGRVMVNIRK